MTVATLIALSFACGALFASIVIAIGAILIDVFVRAFGLVES